MNLWEQVSKLGTSYREYINPRNNATESVAKREMIEAAKQVLKELGIEESIKPETLEMLGRCSGTLSHALIFIDSVGAGMAVSKTKDDMEKWLNSFTK